MPYIYSDPSRETDPYAIPDVEVFEMPYAYCDECDGVMADEDAAGRVVCNDCPDPVRVAPTARGWFYWFCFPGCLPEGDGTPSGPFTTYDAAVAAARAEVSE